MKHICYESHRKQAFQAAKVKIIMLLPTSIVKACAKYQFLDETEKQCRSL